MKKATIIIATIFMAIAVSGQVKGFDLDNVLIIEDDIDVNNYPEQWVKMPERGEAYMLYHTKPKCCRL